MYASLCVIFKAQQQQERNQMQRKAAEAGKSMALGVLRTFNKTSQTQCEQRPWKTVQLDVLILLEGLIGRSLQSDFRVLFISQVSFKFDNIQ